MADENNKKAADELQKERDALGFGSKGSATDSDEDEDQDMGDLDGEEEKTEKETDSEDSDEEEEEDESDDADDSEEEDEDEEDENDEEEDSEQGSSKKKEVIPFKAYNQLRKDLRKTQADLKEALDSNKKLADKLPDDFQERVGELTKKIGVEDPESLKEIINFIKEFAVDKKTAKLEEKITDLEKKVTEGKASTIVDEFPEEWDTFSEDFFTKEFPNATPEQKKEAQKVMYALAHSKKTGGKAYTDKDSGREVLDPYPLDYIYFKNKDQFSAIVTGKKVRGMETSRTQGIRTEKNEDGKVKELPKNASGKDIMALDKQYARMENGVSDNLRSPDNSEI